MQFPNVNKDKNPNVGMGIISPAKQAVARQYNQAPQPEHFAFGSPIEQPALVIQLRASAIMSYLQLLKQNLPDAYRMGNKPRYDEASKRWSIWVRNRQGGWTPSRFATLKDYFQADAEFNQGKMLLSKHAADFCPKFATVEEAEAFWRGGPKYQYYLSPEAMALFDKFWRENVVTENEPDDDNDGPIDVLARPQNVDFDSMPQSTLEVPEQPSLGEILGQIEKSNSEDD